VWDDINVPMISSALSSQSPQEVFADFVEPMTVHSATSFQPPVEVYADSGMAYDADAYHVHDLLQCVPEHLPPQDGAALLKVVETYSDTMHGGLGKFPGPSLKLELKPNATLFYKGPYPVPRSKIEAVKAEVDCVVDFGILEEVFDTPYASPSFAIIKKNGAVRIVTDFRYLNTMIVRSTLSEIFVRLDGFNYCSALDLSMGFYHITLSPRTQLFCTTVFPWGKYKYKRLPMGLSLSPDVF
jgi:hypothetical protein